LAHIYALKNLHYRTTNATNHNVTEFRCGVGTIATQCSGGRRDSTLNNEVAYSDQNSSWFHLVPEHKFRNSTSN